MAQSPVPRCEVSHFGPGAYAFPNRSRERSLAFSASISRSRVGALVCSDASNRRALSETSETARLNASALAWDGALNPDSFRTNCSAEAWISAWVAGGSKLNSVLMLRHMNLLLSRRPKDEQPVRNPTSLGPIIPFGPRAWRLKFA